MKYFFINFTISDQVPGTITIEEDKDLIPVSSVFPQYICHCSFDHPRQVPPYTRGGNGVINFIGEEEARSTDI